ncbi:putative Ras effector 1 C-terminal SARAH (Sav/Rassf/Hpo) domain [Dermatophagoides pteronyssinus]|uniref:Ras effector 1 C-terminal SARAH (Sav/Rassf/Hpo) domain n=1 Tax=Dermatophagoides pteronyssinus TaxID=6956 RepID=A0ABQ8JMK6_DERPT|nr:putative Ras effector 1 C-terminal SARAH (Sav/Rassf/Hpo) domain [Dermatophagoides pteronyssinus]
MSNILEHHLNNNNNNNNTDDDDADDIVISTKSNVLLKNSSISINNNNDADVDDDDRNQFTINESSLLNNNNLKLNDQQVLYNNHISTSKSFPVIQNDYVHSFNDTIDCSSSFNPSTTTSIITNIYDGNDRLTTKSSSTTTIPLINLTNESFIQLFFPNFAQQISTTIMSGLNWINQINAATLFQNIWTSSGFLRRRFSSSSQASSPIPTTTSSSPINNEQSNNIQDDFTYRQYKFAKILNGTIRLQTLKPSELIELSSFGLVELDNDIEPGIGHEFQRYENDKATWCDSCGEFLFPSVMDDNNVGGGGGIDDDDSKTKQFNNNNNNNSDDHDDNDVGQKNSSTLTTTTKVSNTATTTTKTSVSIQADHLLRTYFQCTKCKYICHWKCLHLIRIDCRQHSPQSTMMMIPMIPSSSNDNKTSKTTTETSTSIDNNQSTTTATLSTETSFADDDDNDESSDNTTSTTTMTTSNNSITSVFIDDNNIDESKKINGESNNNVNQQTAAAAKSSSNSSLIIESSYLITPKIISDLRAKILKYNERVRSRGSGLGITLIDEQRCLFRGFLRVHMNLTRPINVIAGKRPPSIYDIINDEENQSKSTTDSTSLQVIKAMLKKFKVVDNPQKFALYLRRRFPQEELNKNGNNDDNDDSITDDTKNQNEMTINKFLKTAGHEHSLKRLHDHERPLILQLEFDSFAYCSVDIVLQENDNADIAWDAFEIPELRNFLKILEREEYEHLQHVRAHYHEMQRILKALIDYEENRLIKNSYRNNNNNNNNNNNDNDTGNQSDNNNNTGNILAVTS